MVDFRLSEEQEALRASVREFAREQVAPVIAAHYENKTFPYDLVRQMGKMGLFGLPFPEEYGGMGGDYFALCLVLEELARELVIDTIVEPADLRGELIRRYAAARGKDRGFSRRRHGVTPV